jgi:hypothetical protein
MSRIVSFGRFWYEFVVGDDWLVAAGVIAALGISAAIAEAGVPAWWLMPLAVVALLAQSVIRAARAADRS